MFGARLLFIVTNLGQFDRLVDRLPRLAGRRGGLRRILSGFAGAVAFCRRRGAQFLAWADCAAPAVAAGLAITPLGCLLAGCDFSRKPWDSPWALRFRRGRRRSSDSSFKDSCPSARRSLVHRRGSASRSSAWRCSPSHGGSCRAFPGQVFLSVVMGYGVALHRPSPPRGWRSRRSVAAFHVAGRRPLHAARRSGLPLRVVAAATAQTHIAAPRASSRAESRNIPAPMSAGLEGVEATATPGIEDLTGARRSEASTSVCSALHAPVCAAQETRARGMGSTARDGEHLCREAPGLRSWRSFRQRCISSWQSAAATSLRVGRNSHMRHWGRAQCL